MNINDLVNKYEQQRSEIFNSTVDYNESQVRLDYLDAFFQILGWDVKNDKGYTDRLREVIIERTYRDGRKYHQRPDYTFQVGGTKIFFCEAKKPAVDILTDKKAAFQTRSYGWTSRLNFSICFNFENLVIYDCNHQPTNDDSANTCLVKSYNYTEYVDKWEEIKGLLGYSRLSDQSSDLLKLKERTKGGITFDSSFLAFLENWRLEFSRDIVRNNPSIDLRSLNFYIQLLLNRILFLRICEEKNYENFEQLKRMTSYEQLKGLFQSSDQKYNSGIFQLLEEEWPFNFRISDSLLIELFSFLYYPNSPYSFSVISPEILGSIYEQYLSKVIVNNAGILEVQEKPEARESGGVVTTPYWLAKKMASDILIPKLSDLTIEQVMQIKVGDICVGSGVFLIVAFEIICDVLVAKLLAAGRETSEFLTQHDGVYKASLYLKHHIAVNNLYGIDIDDQAVEACRFSLLLKMIEGEDSENLTAFFETYGLKALPSLNNSIVSGNSLVERADFLRFRNTASNTIYSVNPFDLSAFVETLGGFDVLIGNPPYIRIQNMKKYAEAEVAFYQGKNSRYTCKKGIFDKYFLFVERAISLIKPTGVISLIVSNKFLSSKNGLQLRDFIIKNAHLSRLINFGHLPLFGSTSVYSCILEIDRDIQNEVTNYSFVKDVNDWLDNNLPLITVTQNDLSENSWMFPPAEISALFTQINDVCDGNELKSVADIFVGLQTSKDSIYIFEATREDENFYYFMKDGLGEVKIEKSIVKPCLYDQEFPEEAVTTPTAKALMIFPYVQINNRMEVLPENEFETRFPKTWEYLNHYKETLSARSIQPARNAKWYQFGRSQSLNTFNGDPKIVWPVLTITPRYTIDYSNTLFTGGGNGPYYGLKLKPETNISIEYLCAVLRFRCVDAFVMNHSSKFRGGYGSHGKQFIESLPIKKIDPLNEWEVEAHDQITTLMRQHAALSQNISALFGRERTLVLNQVETITQEVDRILCNLYNISEQEYLLIRNFFYHSEA